MAWPYLLFALAAGAMIPFQAGVNAQLATRLGSPIGAAFVSFLVGTAALLAVAALVWRPVPSPSVLGDAPWWIWLGGLLGAFYVAGSIVAAPRLGAAALIAAVVAGQAVASLAVDHFGWVGFREHPVTVGRLAGLLLLAAGVALVRFA